MTGTQDAVKWRGSASDLKPVRFVELKPELSLMTFTKNVIFLVLGLIAAVWSTNGLFTAAGILVIAAALSDAVHKIAYVRMRGSELIIGINSVSLDDKFITADEIRAVRENTANGWNEPLHFIHLISSDNQSILQLRLNQWFSDLARATPLINHLQIMATPHVTIQELTDSFQKVRRSYL